MSYYDDGHTALDSKVLQRVETPEFKLVAIGRTLEDGREDVVIHASTDTIFGSTITPIGVLAAAGFSASRRR